MLLQMETLGEKAANHKENLFLARTLRHTRRNVVFVIVEPGWPEHLIELTLPRFSNESSQRDVSTGESTKRIGYLVVVVRADFVLAGPD